MPNITLYREDVESLQKICRTLQYKLCKEGARHILQHGGDDDEYIIISECQRLSDLLLIRLAQNCHPCRERPANWSLGDTPD